MKYARYFCGNHDGVVISEEEYRASVEKEALNSDTINYEPIFDGHIYPTSADSTAAQIATYGCLYNNIKNIPTDTLKEMSDEAFSAYYREATKSVDYQPGMTFPELEKATNRLNGINEELERRSFEERLKAAVAIEYKGIIFDDFAVDATGDGGGVWAEMCQCCAEKYKDLLSDELDDAGGLGACSVDGCGVVGADEEYEHHYYVDFKRELINPLNLKEYLEKTGVEILEYEPNAQKRFGDLFDVATPQECANAFGKPVRDGNKIYMPTPPPETKTLPEGWEWKDFEDGSGCLKSPDGKRQFSYDMMPYAAEGGIEYQNNVGTWGTFYGSLNEFKAFAEENIAAQLTLTKSPLADRINSAQQRAQNGREPVTNSKDEIEL